MEKKKICIISSYHPRECGIAVFAKELVESLSFAGYDITLLPLEEDDRSLNYDSKYYHGQKIRKNMLEDYLEAIRYINRSDFDAVILEHEFGLYGGREGEYIIFLLKQIKIPIITTLHTVLDKPSQFQREVVDQIGKYSRKITIMAQAARNILRAIYKIPNQKIETIYHGIPDISFQDQRKTKEYFGFAEKKVISTFGLIGPGKGIEYVLLSIPMIKEQFPNILYLVCGKTHPNLLAREGEVYRKKLYNLSKKLDIKQNVLFCNEYLSKEELSSLLLTSDVYITPYLNPSQITSGALIHAVGAGRVCVSTPYIHAKELSRIGLCHIVSFADEESIARKIIEIFNNDKLRKKQEYYNYFHTRHQLWKEVAKKYIELITKAKDNIDFQPGKSEVSVESTQVGALS